MRILYPDARELGEEGVREVLGAHQPGKTRANMILSLDGATAIDGDSAALSHSSDRRIYRTLREQADAIIVGAATADHPGYLKVRPRIVVVSNSGRVAHRSFICVTSERGQATAQKNCEHVITAGSESVDLPLAIARLRAQGLERLLCEGGAKLLSAMIQADTIDELFLTLAPVIAGNDSPRLELPHPQRFRLIHLLEDSGYLFTRYGRTSSGTDVGQGSANNPPR